MTPFLADKVKHLDKRIFIKSIFHQCYQRFLIAIHCWFCQLTFKSFWIKLFRKAQSTVLVIHFFSEDGTTTTRLPWARERHRLLLGLRTFSLRILCHGNLCGLSRILWWWFYDVVLLSTNDDIRSNCSFMDSIVGHVGMDLSTNLRTFHIANQRLTF